MKLIFFPKRNKMNKQHDLNVGLFLFSTFCGIVLEAIKEPLFWWNYQKREENVFWDKEIYSNFRIIKLTLYFVQHFSFLFKHLYDFSGIILIKLISKSVAFGDKFYLKFNSEGTSNHGKSWE